MNKKCKKLGIAASKREQIDAHRVKMEMKKALREHNNERYKSSEYVLANISVNHEFYGDTPAEHEARKISS